MDPELRPLLPQLPLHLAFLRFLWGWLHKCQWIQSHCLLLPAASGREREGKAEIHDSDRDYVITRCLFDLQALLVKGQAEEI